MYIYILDKPTRVGVPTILSIISEFEEIKQFSSQHV